MFVNWQQGRSLGLTFAVLAALCLLVTAAEARVGGGSSSGSIFHPTWKVEDNCASTGKRRISLRVALHSPGWPLRWVIRQLVRFWSAGQPTRFCVAGGACRGSGLARDELFPLSQATARNRDGGDGRAALNQAAHGL